MAHKPKVNLKQVVAQGPLPMDIRDTEIESDAFRAKLPDDQGWLAVAVMPGDGAIGDLTFNVQFESAKGKYEQCMQGHNGVLDETAGQIRALLEEIGGEWDLDVVSQPCPHANLPANVVEAARRLEGTVSATRAQSNVVTRTQEHIVSQTPKRGG